MSDEERPADSWFVELMGLLGDAMRGAGEWAKRASEWTVQQAQAYVARVRRVAVHVSIVLAIALAAAVGGILLGQGWVAAVAMIVAAFALGALSLVSFPVLVLAAKFSEFQPVKVALRAVLWLMTWLFGMALLFLVVPFSPRAAVVVGVGSAFLTLLYLASGTTPNLARIQGRVVLLIVLTVLVTIARDALPQLSSGVQGLGATVDRVGSRWLSAGLAPGTVDFGSAGRCWSTAFFGPKGEDLYWYEEDGSGRITVYDRDGVSPLTRQALRPVTPQVRERICSALAEAEAARAAAAAAAREPAVPAAVAPGPGEATAEGLAAQAVSADAWNSGDASPSAEGSLDADISGAALVQPPDPYEQQNARSLSSARDARDRGDLLRARREIEVVLSRSPSHEEASRLYAEWSLHDACAACATVLAVEDRNIDRNDRSLRYSMRRALDEVLFRNSYSSRAVARVLAVRTDGGQTGDVWIRPDTDYAVGDRLMLQAVRSGSVMLRLRGAAPDVPWSRGGTDASFRLR